MYPSNSQQLNPVSRRTRWPSSYGSCQKPHRSTKHMKVSHASSVSARARSCCASEGSADGRNHTERFAGSTTSSTAESSFERWCRVLGAEKVTLACAHAHSGMTGPRADPRTVLNADWRETSEKSAKMGG